MRILQIPSILQMLLVVVCSPAVLFGQAPSVTEIWEASYISTPRGAVKNGYVRTTIQPLKFKGDQVELYKTTKELRLSSKRGGQLVQLKADLITEETPTNEVTAVRATMYLGADSIQKLDCEVENQKTVHISATGATTSKRSFDWDPRCIGMRAENNLFAAKKIKPGDTFTYRQFIAQITYYITIEVKVGELQETIVPGLGKKKLLKVEATPEALILPNKSKLQLPISVFLVDPITYEPIVTITDIAELGGLVTTVRTTKAIATAPNGNVPDLMERNTIYLAKRLPRLHQAKSAKYRIGFKGDLKPSELISVDERQKLDTEKEQSFDLVITASRVPPEKDSGVAAAEEFTQSNEFIASDDANIQKLAALAVGDEKNPWKKALKIEQFVNNYIDQVTFTEALTPADKVAVTRKGDCTEFAMLTAAICRASGLPSRTAIGLVYVDNIFGKPGLGFHMWTEVYINGAWLGLDATLAQGGIGPGHLKITDHSWSGIVSFTPLLPVQRFLNAAPKVEIVE
ncbi:MAG: transglutaminase-like domain-containing protein [Zavarzinella sp.]